jgi:hypothetical protein
MEKKKLKRKKEKMKEHRTGRKSKQEKDERNKGRKTKGGKEGAQDGKLQARGKEEENIGDKHNKKRMYSTMFHICFSSHYILLYIV